MTDRNFGLILVLLMLSGGFLHAAKLLDTEQYYLNQKLHFNPKFSLEISDKIAEAVNNGIAVTFVAQANMVKNVDWWFDTTIQHNIQTFKLHYYSMSRLYQLENVSRHTQQNFISLELLLEQLSKETEFVFGPDVDGDYIETRIFLDKQALPSIMQLPTVFDQDWNINSDWQSVPIIKNTGTAE